MDPLLASLMLFAGNFIPRGYLACNGQLIQISQNTALFSLLGTTYGGNGTTTFAVPDLRGRVPVGVGQGGGLSNYDLGQAGGTENTTLTQSNMPNHTHGINVTAAQAVTSGPGGSESPVGTIPASSGASENFAAPASANGFTGGLSVTATAAPAGGSTPFSNVQPYLTLTWCIASEGVYPSRN